MASPAQVLDAIHALAKLEAFTPDAFLAPLADELAALPAASTIEDLAARDDVLRAALAAIDAFTARAMKIRLDHVLAADTAIPPPTRKVFATTIIAYADNLGALAERVRDIAARVDRRGADATADGVVAAARASLGLRDDLRAGVLAHARDLAAAALAHATARAKDPGLDDAVRLKWSAMRRDLEAIVARPEHVAAAPQADRLAALPPLLDEAEREPERSFGELLELD